jgi:hypothetical protein
VRTWGIATVVAGCVALGGCRNGVPAPQALPSPTPAVTVPVVATDVPAQQALTLVPQSATVLTVTDFARIRDQLGDDGHQDAAFWARVDEEAPLLTRGMLRDGTSTGGLDQRDVLWEAHFTGGAEGYVVRFADGADLDRLTPPPGARIRAAEHLLVSGVAVDPQHSWAAVPGLLDLVPDRAEATYLHRGCVAGEAATDLEALEAYSLELGSTVATARLGPGRHDLFRRMRLGQEAAGFDEAFAEGAADPSSGRIGYRLVDAAEAADLTLRQRLPFAVCAR